MSVKFRPHRCSIEDSMKEVREVSSFDDIIKILEEDELPNENIKIEKIQVIPYCFDQRINWDTFIVFIYGYGVIGFTNGDLKN